MDKSTGGNKTQQLLKSVSFFTNYGEDPCAHLRLRGPMRHLGIDVIDGKVGGNTYPEYVLQGDVAVLQRDFPRDLPAYEKIVRIAHENKKPIIYDIDDLLFLMPETHPERQSQHYIESLLPMLQALHEADTVTTTTPKLRDELLKFNSHVHLLPNYFDDSIWQLRQPVKKPNSDDPLIIGYMGSISHMPDLEYLLPVLKRLLDEYGDDLEFHFWSIKPPTEIANYPQVKWIPVVSYEYEDFTAYFQTQYADIVIAPLIDNLFNRAKSPLKFFEYTALGAPGVYSNLETFDQVVVHGQNGFLASSLEEWHQYLKMLIEDGDLRLKLANKAQETVRVNWLLSENAHQWREIYQKSAKRLTPDDINNQQDLKLIRSLNQQYFSLNQTRNILLDKRQKEIQSLEKEIQSLDFELEEREIEIQSLSKNLTTKEESIQRLSFELSEIKISKAWKLALLVRKFREIILPRGSFLEKMMRFIFHWLQGQRTRLIRRKNKERLDPLINTEFKLDQCEEVDPHKEEIDIIVCVHNALEDVRKCLESVIAHTQTPYNIILVDDGSDSPAQNYLREFVNAHHQSTLIRNDAALGYTFAANIGLRASQAPFLILLNSDTIVTPNWINRLYRTITRDEKIGVVGPLSNTASWQSIPKISNNGDWASNPLPEDVTITKMGQTLAKYSGCIHPSVPLLNGFCMMIRRDLIDDIGYFDEAAFGQGYGEEDDFNLRANKAGWASVISDDTYVFHAQSKSYSNEKRYALQQISGVELRKKHGLDLISESVEFMNPNRVMEGIRSRAEIMFEREGFINKGQENYAGKKVLFVLPVIDAGGGANVIIDEARCMQKMGVDVRIFNLSEYKSGFLANYSHIDLPFIFRDAKDLPKVAKFFDAVVASANYSVPWLKPLKSLGMDIKLGYYVQGFEPLMYQPGSNAYQQAVDSYTMIGGIKRFTKTQWTRNAVLENTKADSDVVGISVNIDLFRPRDMIPLGVKPVTIVAMIRPSSPYRNPEMTMEILGQIEKKYGNDVDIWLFGANDVHEIVSEKYLDFNWRQLGKLTQLQVASMMSKADIFTDFSSHQAMGLSALEAMAAGCSAIVPENGGAVEFIKHLKNGIVADTSYIKSSLNALEELIEDDVLRKRLQIAGIHDVVRYYPERVSYNILSTLFNS